MLLARIVRRIAELVLISDRNVFIVVYEFEVADSNRGCRHTTLGRIVRAVPERASRVLRWDHWLYGPRAFRNDGWGLGSRGLGHTIGLR